MRMASTSTEATPMAMSVPEYGSEMLKPGTTLLTCEPFVYASYLQYPELPVCDSCLIVKEIGLLRCQACQTVWYCNKTCQKKGWKDGHKHECKMMSIFMRMFELAPRASRLKLMWKPRILLRLIVKLQDDSDCHDELNIGGNTVKRRFWDLMSHSEELKNDKEHMDEVERLIRTLKLLMGPNPGIKIPTDEELIEIYARLNINAFDIGDGFNTVGGGLYIASSIFNHSCNPMAVRVFEGPTMHVRNITEIPKSLPIDKVTICYTSTLVPSQKRREELLKGHHFHCLCERCETGLFDKEMRSVICSNKGCKAEIDTEDMKNPCSVCGHVMNAEAIQKVLETEKYAVRMSDVENLGLGDLETIIRRMKSVQFSDSHWLMLKLLEKAYDEAAAKDSTGKIRNLEMAYEYGSKYISGLKRYLPPFDKHLLWHLYEVSWFAISMKKLDEAEKLMSEARCIGEVLFGKNSSFMRIRIGPLQGTIERLKVMTGMRKLGLSSVKA